MTQEFAKPPYVIGIAGGTGSGKTTFSRELVATLMTNKIVYMSHDSYYRDLSDLPFSERVKQNFDHPDALETDLLIKHLEILRSGKAKGVRFSTVNRICYYLQCDIGDILKFDGHLEEDDDEE